MCRDCPAFRWQYPQWWGNTRSGIHSVFYEAWARHAFYRWGNGGPNVGGGGGGGQSMTWEELCDDDVDVWFAHASHSWFMKLLGSPCDQTAYVMKRCSLGCIHLDSDSQLLRGPWGGVGEGRVSRHHVFLVSGVACQNASSCFLYLTWKSLHHFTLVVLSPVATVKS